jgi:hypothetical protein
MFLDFGDKRFSFLKLVVPNQNCRYEVHLCGLFPKNWFRLAGLLCKPIQFIRTALTRKSLSPKPGSGRNVPITRSSILAGLGLSGLHCIHTCSNNHHSHFLNKMMWRVSLLRHISMKRALKLFTPCITLFTLWLLQRCHLFTTTQLSPPNNSNFHKSTANFQIQVFKLHFNYNIFEGPKSVI